MDNLILFSFPLFFFHSFFSLSDLYQNDDDTLSGGIPNRNCFFVCLVVVYVKFLQITIKNLKYRPS